MAEIMQYDLRELNMVSIIVRIVLATVIGGVLGLERGRKNRPAGMRTHMLVCLGAAMVMMTNQYVVQVFEATDPVRMGAQVISGIGFLGAGTIMVTGKNQIKGITTAAGLWTAACCGLAIGIGFYEGAVLGGIAIFIVMALMHKLDAHLKARSKIMDLYMEFSSESSFREFIEYTRTNDIEMFDVQIQKNKPVGENLRGMFLSVYFKERRPHQEVIQLLSDGPGAQFIEEI